MKNEEFATAMEKMKIVFATNNQHKLEEVRQILGDSYEVLSLADIGCHEDIPERGRTIEENAFQKAHYVACKYEMDCFADDTALEVEALDGEPGVYSARYAATAPDGFPAGGSHDSEANMTKLLEKLGDSDNRRARFRTIVALVRLMGGPYALRVNLFQGIVEGEITSERSGSEGFGYDPIFRPDGYDKTFAELGAEVKNKISHRARAVQKLAAYLKEEA